MPVTLLEATEENKISQPIFKTQCHKQHFIAVPLTLPCLPPYRGGEKRLKLLPHLVCKEDTSQLNSAHAHTGLSSDLSCFVTED